MEIIAFQDLIAATIAQLWEFNGIVMHQVVGPVLDIPNIAFCATRVLGKSQS